MDDLIRRKAAIEVIRGILNTSVGFTCALEEMISMVETIPSVHAVQLDKLCEWLAAENVTIPCHLCDYFKDGRCIVENDMKTLCPGGADEWRKVLEKGMEG